MSAARCMIFTEGVRCLRQVGDAACLEQVGYCEEHLREFQAAGLVPYYHERAEDCDVDPETGCCRYCGVDHGEPCPVCDKRGFHADGCPGEAPGHLMTEGEYLDTVARATEPPPPLLPFVLAAPIIEPEAWIFTFGFDHIHPVTGDLLAHCYIRIPGTIDTSRQKMMDVFGRDWAQQYPLAMGLELVAKHKLNEIPWGGR